ncbi:MAG: SusD/RagB family nutrient-binding outer membrane lipoprotein [Rikenellaceae bacterium]
MKQAKYIIATLVASVAVTACTKNFEEYNTNTNSLSQGSIAPISMLEPLLFGQTQNHAKYMLSIANEISQVTVAKTTPRREHCYNLSDQDYTNIWDRCYLDATDSKHMYDLAVDQDDVNFQAIALTMKVYYLSIVTDMFGSIPYSEALLGSQGITQPIVESQQSVYTQMMAELELANSLYDTTIGMSDNTKDGMFGGDIAKWKRFTNSLHLRLLMRVAGRSSSFSPSVEERFAKIVNDQATYPIFTSNDDDASVKYTGSSTEYYNYFNTVNFSTESALSSDHHISSQFLDMIYDDAAGYTDPRLYVWIKARYTASSIYDMIGAPSGSTIEHNSLSSRTPNEPYLHYETLVHNSGETYWMCYDELLFILAEAAMKGWISGSAQEYYEAAVTASCQKWGAYGELARFPFEKDSAVTTNSVAIDSSAINTLLASDRAKWDGTEQRLAEQKWLSLFWVVGFQMYHEMRRTGYPECKVGEGVIELNKSDGKFIARYAYPMISIANNRANYEVAMAEMGLTVDADDNIVTPVWWSGQAVAADAGTPWDHTFRTLEIAYED